MVIFNYVFGKYYSINEKKLLIFIPYVIIVIILIISDTISEKCSKTIDKLDNWCR